jgi:hypothetical protein
VSIGEPDPNGVPLVGNGAFALAEASLDKRWPKARAGVVVLVRERLTKVTLAH